MPNPKIINGRILNVVQPDICIICNPKIIDQLGCHGVPNLIVEILSPSTERKDQKDKFELYEQNEVQGYWIVNPSNKSVIVYTLHEKKKIVALHAHSLLQIKSK